MYTESCNNLLTEHDGVHKAALWSECIYISHEFTAPQAVLAQLKAKTDRGTVKRRNEM